MPGIDSPSGDLVRQVRSALAHLYDYAYLQNHPLAALIDAEQSLDQVTRAQALRRLLLDCIEVLRPQELESAPSDAARAHAILTYRYVDSLPMCEIAERRGLSERQAYRELEKGVEAVASLLQDRMGEAGAAGEDVAEDRQAQASALQAAEAEVARLRQAVKADSLDVRDTIRGILDLLAPICKRAGSEIRIISPELWPLVLADRVMLRQALLSLFTYALNATTQGCIEVSATSGQEHLSITLRAHHTPIEGVPLPSAPTEEAHMGLSVARALLEAQGGALVTESEGSHWLARVRLPTTRGVTVLVVDDNQDLVALLRRYLAGHDITVVGATSGEQALRLAVELQPQIVTLDVMMPNQDGWEVLQRLRNEPATAGIPVVICSVLRERELATAMGASDYITKPVSQEELLDVFRRWLGPLVGRLPPAG